MPALNERLKKMKEKFLQSASADVVEIMDRSTEALRASGILDRLPKIGDRLPAFELEDTAGQPVRSDDLLKTGPLVLTFYRGVW